ncbi:hypothetical protein ABT297_00945 [Dactylosporangium sp. NPDC000555]|uniref:hypothetical protein n=1 Tax=Dactylosporangium sp. NPDC000555 TaxID=3154260 RepID=UPI00333366BD
MTLSTRSPGRLAAILAVPALLFALTGCGDGGAASGSSSAAPAADSRQAWMLKYAQCLRDNGVDVKDPEPGPGDSVNMNAWEAPGAVLDKCAAKVGNLPPLSKEEKAKHDQETQKVLLKIVGCYRENGVNVPDPVPGEALNIPAGTPKNVLDKCGGAVGSLTPAGE